MWQLVRRLVVRRLVWRLVWRLVRRRLVRRLVRRGGGLREAAWWRMSCSIGASRLTRDTAHAWLTETASLSMRLPLRPIHRSPAGRASAWRCN
eukprot:4428919-Prymnesium_polylepis.1